MVMGVRFDREEVKALLQWRRDNYVENKDIRTELLIKKAGLTVKQIRKIVACDEKEALCYLQAWGPSISWLNGVLTIHPKDKFVGRIYIALIQQYTRLLRKYPEALINYHEEKSRLVVQAASYHQYLKGKHANTVAQAIFLMHQFACSCFMEDHEIEQHFAKCTDKMSLPLICDSLSMISFLINLRFAFKMTNFPIPIINQLRHVLKVLSGYFARQEKVKIKSKNAQLHLADGNKMTYRLFYQPEVKTKQPTKPKGKVKGKPATKVSKSTGFVYSPRPEKLKTNKGQLSLKPKKEVKIIVKKSRKVVKPSC